MKLRATLFLGASLFVSQTFANADRLASLDEISFIASTAKAHIYLALAAIEDAPESPYAQFQNLLYHGKESVYTVLRDVRIELRKTGGCLSSGNPTESSSSKTPSRFLGPSRFDYSICLSPLLMSQNVMLSSFRAYVLGLVLKELGALLGGTSAEGQGLQGLGFFYFSHWGSDTSPTLVSRLRNSIQGTRYASFWVRSTLTFPVEATKCERLRLTLAQLEQTSSLFSPIGSWPFGGERRSKLELLKYRFRALTYFICSQTAPSRFQNWGTQMLDIVFENDLAVTPKDFALRAGEGMTWHGYTFSELISRPALTHWDRDLYEMGRLAEQLSDLIPE